MPCERTSITAAMGTTASSVIFHRRRTGKGCAESAWIQAAAARRMANPIWIHSEVRIRDSQQRTSTVQLSDANVHSAMVLRPPRNCSEGRSASCGLTRKATGRPRLSCRRYRSPAKWSWNRRRKPTGIHLWPPRCLPAGPTPCRRGVTKPVRKSSYSPVALPPTMGTVITS